KVDGERCFVYSNKDIYIITNSEIKKVQNGYAHNFLLDAEVYEDNIHAFDCLIYEGQLTFEDHFRLRLPKLRKSIEFLKRFISIEEQEFIKFNNSAILYDVYNKKRRHPIDGLVFPDSKDYFRSRNYKWKPPEKQTIDFFAIRCPESLLGKEPYIPRKDHDLMLLFVGISCEEFDESNLTYVSEYSKIFECYTINSTYFPVQFSPSSNPLAYLYYH